MKRIVALFMVLFYVSSVSGMTFNLHYCGGKLQKVTLAGAGKKTCCCKSKMKSGCCKNKLVSIKASKAYKSDQTLSITAPIPQNVPVLLPVFATVQTFPIAHQSLPNFHSPPIREALPDLLILHSTFRI